MRLVVRCIGLFLAVYLTPVSAQILTIPPGRSIWRHNDSAVYLVVEGSSQRFYYQAPRPGLDQVGIKEDTLLFQGGSTNGMLAGTAYIFSKKCGPAGYSVQGALSDRLIQLTGKAPTRNGTCQVIGTRDDQLVFDFVFKSEADHEDAIPETTAFKTSPKAAILSDPKGVIDVAVRLAQPKNSEIASSIVYGIAPMGALDLSTCFYEGGFLNDSRDSENKFLGFYYRIASYSASTAAKLRILGYPEAIWRPRLAGLQNELLNTIIDQKSKGSWSGFDYGTLHERVLPTERNLIAALNAYAASTGNRLLPVQNMDSCGGDFWGSFKVKLDPSDGRIWFIDNLNYSWCKKAGYALDHCDYWVRVPPELSLPFGIYQYRIEWPDGTKETDKLDVGDARQDGTTLTIRKQR
jgi:hypothetical protein